jgi:hypothetical protein
MLDLIPIGAATRMATENNTVKRSGNIHKAAKIERFETEHKQKVEEPCRRFKKRQRSGGGYEQSKKIKKPSRKGCIIDDSA